MIDAMMITADELAYLQSLEAQERATMAALRGARQSFETHLAARYGLASGDQIRPDGTIVRQAPAAEA